MQINLAELIELGKDYMQLGIPAALAILAYRQKVLDDKVTEIKNLLFEHILPKKK